MSKQQLTASSDNCGNGKEEKTHPQNSKRASATIQYTFYQPHLSQPPTDYMFLDDNPTQTTAQNLHTTTKIEQKPRTNVNSQHHLKEQRLESGAYRKDSYDLSGDNPLLSVKSKLMEEWEVCQTQEKGSNESVRGSTVEIISQTEQTEQSSPSPQRCSAEGKFIPQKNHIPPNKRTPITVERGYLLWQLQKTGDEVEHLETIMQRTVEQKQLETESEDATLGILNP